MYKRILVPLDGSEVAASVLPYVVNLAKRLSASVTLLTVIAATRRAPEVAHTASRKEAAALLRESARGARPAISNTPGPAGQSLNV